jgi:hypothetical protein
MAAFVSLGNANLCAVPSEKADMMMADLKHKPRQEGADREQRERRRRQEEALDEALANTFPASDPVSVVQPGPP